MNCLKEVLVIRDQWIFRHVEFQLPPYCGGSSEMVGRGQDKVHASVRVLLIGSGTLSVSGFIFLT